MKYQKIKQAIDSGLLSEDMREIAIPPKPEEIVELQNSLDFSLVADHVALLLEWGGSSLDEIRINNIDKVVHSDGDFIEFASDFSGFIYKYDKDGIVYLEDTDGGDVKKIANSVLEFIDEVFWGIKGGELYGEEWIEDLKKHNLV